MSNAEELLYQMILTAGLPQPVREFAFASPRRWRFDLAFPSQMVAFEIEGGTWILGRHTSGVGFRRDCDKYNMATLLGWRVYRVTTDMVLDGSALELVRKALGRQDD